MSPSSGGQKPVKRTLALIVAIVALPLAAQKNPPEPAQPKLVESIDIRVIDVDVIVTDRKGNPVTGLTKDDFEVYENGTKKVVTNFYEVEGTKAKNVAVEVPGQPAAEPSNDQLNENLKRRIIFYVDNLSLAPFNRNRVFQQMKEFVQKVMRPGDEAMMATYNRSMKILVLTSEGFPMQPGREAFYMIDEMQRTKGWGVGSTMLETVSYDASNLIQSVAKTANANDITMYTIHAAGLVGGTDMSAEYSNPTSTTVTQAASTNSMESMQLMADMTGGLASVQSNNFAAAFQRIQRDLDSYYSLGYRAGTERVDRQRYLSVKLKNRKDLIVRSRQTFVEKSVYAEMSDRVVANLLYRVKENDLGILTRLGQAIPTGDGYFKVPVDVQIPMAKLALLPQGESEYAGGFDIYVVVANKDNDMSDVARKGHQIHVPNDQMKTTSGKFYTYTLELLTEPGLNKISIGVVDQISNESGFSREQIIARDTR